MVCPVCIGAAVAGLVAFKALCCPCTKEKPCVPGVDPGCVHDTGIVEGKAERVYI